MTGVIKSHLQSHQQARIKGSSGQTCDPPLPEDADPGASNAMSMAFSVLWQQIKSYSVKGKQAGEFRALPVPQQGIC